MTLPFPEGIVAFQTMFSDERACERYLYALRYPGGFVCPKCGNDRPSEYDGVKVTQCANHHLTSLTSGTAMHKTKQPLQTWFWAAYFVSTHTPGISAVQFQKHLQIGRYETAFQLLHKVRSALVDPERETLHGVIEMDEMYYTQRNGARAVIIGAIEVRERKDGGGDDPHGGGFKGGTKIVGKRPTYAGRLRMQVIPDETAATFLAFATKNVLRGATIHTDGDPSYNGLTALGYDHRPKVQGKGKTAVYGLDHLHRAFSNFRNWLAGTHHNGVDPKHVQAYCNEYVFRQNRRWNPWAAFNRCLGLSADAEGRPEYRTLYKAGDEGGWVHPTPRQDKAIYATLEAVAKAADDPALAEWMEPRREVVQAVIWKAVAPQPRRVRAVPT